MTWLVAQLDAQMGTTHRKDTVPALWILGCSIFWILSSLLPTSFTKVINTKKKIQIQTIDQMDEQISDMPNFTVYSCIGKACGNFANVYLAKRTNGKTLAIRVCPLDSQEIDLAALLREINMMRSLRHPNIIALEEVITNGDYLCMVWPLMDFGSVNDLIHARFMFGLPEAAIVMILHDVLKAVDYLHSRDVIHRGIRSSHILLSSDGRAVLIGLRNSVCVLQDGKRVHVVHEFRPDFKSNLLWLAPEVLQQNLSGYCSKSDIYSIGISACEMANGFPPFSDMAHMQMLFEKLRGTTPRLLDATTLVGEDLPKSTDGSGEGVANEQKERRFSLHLHNFTELCLRSNPNERPSAFELLSHPFFKHGKRLHRGSFREILHPIKPLVPPTTPGAAGECEKQPSMPAIAEAASSSTSDTRCRDVEWQFD